MLGGTVQVRGPGSKSPSKKMPVATIRKPIPPRVAPGRPQTAKMKKIAQEERGSVKPQSFKAAQARELAILPPTFTAKNLQTKDRPKTAAPIKFKKDLKKETSKPVIQEESPS